MSAAADRKRIENLYARWQKAPRGTKQRRHLRRALERAVEQATRHYERKPGRPT